MNRTLLFAGLLAAIPLSGCGGNDHAHGPDTHTHDAAPAAATTPSTTFLDTTGVAADTTGFFDAAEAEAAHRAGGRHTHADGTTHDH